MRLHDQSLSRARIRGVLSKRTLLALVVASALALVVALWLVTQARHAGSQVVMLREESVDLRYVPSGEAIAGTEQRIGFELWVPDYLPRGMRLQFVDSKVQVSGEQKPWGLLGFANAEGTTLSLYEYPTHVEFPEQNAIPIDSGVSGVSVWTPPSSFRDKQGRVNSQFIVRTRTRQWLLWFVGQGEVDTVAVQRMIGSLASYE